MNTKGILVFIGSSLLLNACATTQMGTGFPGFRHPVLRDVQAMSPQQTASAFKFENKRTDLDQHCVRSFRHIALNRCSRWLPSETKSGATLDSATPVRICDGSAQECRTRLAKRARQMMKHPRFRVGGESYSRSCSGFVLATLTAAEMPIGRLVPPRAKGEGGVSLLYRMIAQRGGLHHHKVPQIGDLVFFDNTHDRNGNGRADDRLTHVGLVEKVDADGTVTFIHHVERGVLRYKMNLFRPGERRDAETGKVLNHYVRLGRAENGRRLTGELFNGFGSLIP